MLLNSLLFAIHSHTYCTHARRQALYSGGCTCTCPGVEEKPLEASLWFARSCGLDQRLGKDIQHVADIIPGGIVWLRAVLHARGCCSLREKRSLTGTRR